MGRIIPTEIKDLYEMTPAGTLLMQVTNAQEAWVGKEGEEVYGIVISHLVVEPPSCAGIEHNETFFIGVNESAKQVQQGKLKADPEAANDDTWKARAAGFKRYMEKHGIAIEGADLDMVLQTVVGKQILGKVVHVTSKTLREDGTPFVNARVERWFAPGEVAPELAPVAAAAPAATAPGNGARPAGPAPGPRPAAPAPAGAAAVGTAVPFPGAPAAAAPPARPPMRRIGR